MSVFSRSALESSPLADLHEIASELGIDGFRRLRKADLVGAILERQGVADTNGAASSNGAATAAADEEDAPAGRPARRPRRSSRATRDADPSSVAPPSGDRASASRGGDRAATPRAAERVAEGVVELLDNGSAFLRTSPPDPSDDDVYISAAQVRRCELVSGDQVAGPVRAPRRSERYASLARVDSINGRSAEEVSEGTRFEDLPVAWPNEPFALGTGTETLGWISKLAPLGRGSRAIITGPRGAGRSATLRMLADVLAAQEGLDVTVVLAGVRPEEVADWREGPAEVTAAAPLGSSSEAQSQPLERAIDTAKRVAARGGNAVVLIDSLDQVPLPLARRALAAARNIADGGSLTVIATARETLGGETAVIALAPATRAPGAAAGAPALDEAASATLRMDLLAPPAPARRIRTRKSPARSAAASAPADKSAADEASS